MREQKILHDVETEAGKDFEHGLELAKGEKLDQVVDAANDLYDKIERDEPVKVGDVDKLEEALGKVEVDFFGEKFSIKQMREMPKFLENIEIYNAVKKCHDPLELKTINYDSITYLTIGFARFLVNESDLGVFFFDNLTSITDEVAEVLSSFEGKIYFDSFEKLSDQQASYFTNSVGDEISFLSLKEVSDKVIELLAKSNRNFVLPDDILQRVDVYRRNHPKENKW